MMLGAKYPIRLLSTRQIAIATTLSIEYHTQRERAISTTRSTWRFLKPTLPRSDVGETHTARQGDFPDSIDMAISQAHTPTIRSGIRRPANSQGKPASNAGLGSRRPGPRRPRPGDSGLSRRCASGQRRCPCFPPSPAAVRVAAGCAALGLRPASPRWRAAPSHVPRDLRPIRAEPAFAHPTHTRAPQNPPRGRRKPARPRRPSGRPGQAGFGSRLRSTKDIQNARAALWDTRTVPPPSPTAPTRFYPPATLEADRGNRGGGGLDTGSARPALSGLRGGARRVGLQPVTSDGKPLEASPKGSDVGGTGQVIHPDPPRGAPPRRRSPGLRERKPPADRPPKPGAAKRGLRHSVPSARRPPRAARGREAAEAAGGSRLRRQDPDHP